MNEPDHFIEPLPRVVENMNAQMLALDGGFEPGSIEGRILTVIRSFGKEGCISDQIRTRFPDEPYSTVTGKYSVLERKGKIEVIGKRPGKSGRKQKVMRVL